MTAIVIHGGAGNISAERLKPTRDAIERQIDRGIDMLANGKTALDVVEQVLARLEDDPLFDSGTGSYPNCEGDVEMDAIIVDGGNLDFGAVAGIQNVRNPVSVARKVLDHCECCMLVAKGAQQFARKHGFDYVGNEVLARSPETDRGHGTVGAVAIDSQGFIAAATSTGGTPNKFPGRVGDTPLIGCGAIADNSIGGVSATGEGEPLMRMMVSKTVLSLMDSGRAPRNACTQAITEMRIKTGGRGGVVCLSRDGQLGFAFNTQRMPIAYANSRGVKEVLL